MQNKSENPIDLLLNFLQKREITESEQYYQQIRQNSEKFIPAIVQKVYSFEDETIKQSFIRNLHARLVWEMDYFTETIEQNVKEVSKKDVN